MAETAEAHQYAYQEVSRKPTWMNSATMKIPEATKCSLTTGKTGAEQSQVGGRTS
jgi:hypothetical protein